MNFFKNIFDFSEDNSELPYYEEEEESFIEVHATDSKICAAIYKVSHFISRKVDAFLASILY